MNRSLQAVLNRPTPDASKRKRRRLRYPLDPSPEKVAFIKNQLYAAWYVSRLVALGHLSKAADVACALCGGPGYQWHHEDYSRPEAVVAVCRQCHKAADAVRRHWERE